MTTEKKYPVKECDYCDHVGMAYTSMAGETMCKSCLSELPSDAAECRKLVVEQRKRIAELETELDKACNDLANFEGYPEEVSALRHDIERRKQRYLNLLNKRKGWKERAEQLERELDELIVFSQHLIDCHKNGIQCLVDIDYSEFAGKFAIKQQIKALEHEASLWPDDLTECSHVKSSILGSAEKLRQQLGGETE